MRVRFYDICWDTSGDEAEDSTPEEYGLPSECIMDTHDDMDVAEEGAHALSNEYGFCVRGFSFEELSS